MKKIVSKIIAGYQAFRQSRGLSRAILIAMVTTAMGLMLIGLLMDARGAAPFSLPGPAVLSPGQIAHNGSIPAGLVVMSIGILLLALLPDLRVLFGIRQFVQRHETVNLIAAIIVFIELTAGILLIFHVKGVLI